MKSWVIVLWTIDLVIPVSSEIILIVSRRSWLTTKLSASTFCSVFDEEGLQNLLVLSWRPCVIGTLAQMIAQLLHKLFTKFLMQSYRISHKICHQKRNLVFDMAGMQLNSVLTYTWLPTLSDIVIYIFTHTNSFFSFW